jgi:outer membrane receptor protein involved in Fe transport
MKMKFLILIVCFLSLNSFKGMSQIQQKGMLQIEVLDKITNAPLEYVGFILYNEDSVKVGSAFSDSLGMITMEKVAFGNYNGKLLLATYNSLFLDSLVISKEQQGYKFGPVYLEPSLTDEEMVQITARKEAYVIGIDKKVYNVEQDLSVKGGTVIDVLNNVPSITVDQDGNISLRGDANVTILIDGRPSSFSGSSKSLLDALPANSVERIEIVSNPSAKYDPDGTSGIINIVLKKNKLRGTNVMVSTTLGTSDFYSGTISLSHRNEMVNIYGNYSYNYSLGYRNKFGVMTQFFDDGSVATLDQNRTGTHLRAGHTARVGMDYYLKPNQTLGFSFTGAVGEVNRTGETINKMLDIEDILYRHWYRNSFDPENNQNLELNLNYKLELEKNRGTLTVEATGSQGGEDSKGFYNEGEYQLETTTIEGDPTLQKLLNAEGNEILTIQSDYVRLFDAKKARFESGVKAIVRNQDVSTDSYTMDLSTATYQPDTISTFDYNYQEQIYSAYGIFGQELGKFKYQGGLRFEQAYQIPYLLSTEEKIVNNYFNIFPSAHLKYMPKESVEWSVSYSKRINRASARNLNPFSSYSDPYNLRKGNPYLRPEYINSFDLGLAKEFKNLSITGSVFYRKTNDVIQRIKIVNPDNTAAVTFSNIAESHSGGLESITTFQIAKRWRNMVSLNGNFIKFVDSSTALNLNNQGVNWSLKYVSSVDFFNKTMRLQVNYSYFAPMYTAIGIVQRRGGLDVSVDKSFNNGVWNVSARVSDVFNQQGFEIWLDQPNLEQHTEFKWLTRRVYLTLTYKFGKMELSQKDSSGGGGQGMDF